MKSLHDAHHLYVHITWNTEKRLLLIDEHCEKLLKEIITGICHEMDYELISLGMVPDHVHLLVRFQPTHRLSEFVKTLKGRTSRLITSRTGQAFHWQQGYGIDTVGLKSLDIAKQYVDTQKEHHRHRFDE